jgi:TRAP-type transport system small permease protein
LQGLKERSKTVLQTNLVMTEKKEAGKRAWTRWMEHLLVLGLSVMGLMVFSNVVLRYVFDSGIAIAEEVSRFIFVWLTLVGAVVAMQQGLNLGMDAIYRKLPYRWAMAVRTVSNVLILFCCAMLLKGSLAQALQNAGNVSALSGLPVGLMYGAGIFASVCMSLITLQDIWRTITRREKHKPCSREQVQEV